MNSSKSIAMCVAAALLMRKKSGISGAVFGIALILGLFAISGFGATGEFQPDENTLFLAHYNTTLDADYGGGGKKYERMDAGYLTKGGGGYFGEGLVCRVGTEAVRESGAEIPEDTGLLPAKAFDGLRYPLPGNLDLKRGTFECWVKPYFSIKTPKELPNQVIIYTLFAFTDWDNDAGKHLTVGFNQNPSGDIIPHFFFTSRKGPHLDIAGGEIDWKPGTWHHVAIVWDNTEEPGQGAFFLDGKKVAGKSFEILEGGFLKQSSQFPVFSIGANIWRKSGGTSFGKIDALVDEVRISNIVRYRETFELPKKPQLP